MEKGGSFPVVQSQFLKDAVTGYFALKLDFKWCPPNVKRMTKILCIYERVYVRLGQRNCSIAFQNTYLNPDLHILEEKIPF